jgi:hypothetical protein
MSTMSGRSDGWGSIDWSGDARFWIFPHGDYFEGRGGLTIEEFRRIVRGIENEMPEHIIEGEEHERLLAALDAVRVATVREAWKHEHEEMVQPPPGHVAWECDHAEMVQPPPYHGRAWCKRCGAIPGAVDEGPEEGAL